MHQRNVHIIWDVLYKQTAPRIAKICLYIQQLMDSCVTQVIAPVGTEHAVSRLVVCLEEGIRYDPWSMHL